MLRTYLIVPIRGVVLALQPLVRLGDHRRIRGVCVYVCVCVKPYLPS